MIVETLDLSQFTSGTQEQRRQFAERLLTSFDKSGFVKLTGHGFSQKRLKDLFTWSKKFFDQPLEVKNEIPNKDTRVMRGFTPCGIEYVSKLHEDEKIRAMSDSKEHFDQGPTEDAEYPNQWPGHPEMAGFRSFMEGFYEQCDLVCLTLMKAVEFGFGVHDGSLVKRCIPNGTDLRLTHYPPIQIEEMRSGHISRCAQHSDFGIITLLFQDSTGGLEVEDRSNPKSFIPLLPDDTTEMIVNVGDTLQRWTNGHLVGGVHRVTTPATLKDSAGVTLPERTSMAYLLKAERTVSVGPLPQFVSKDMPAKYDDMTALDWQQMRNGILYT